MRIINKIKLIRAVVMMFGIAGGFFSGSLFSLLTIHILSDKLHWFEGMKLAVALILILPAGGILAAIATGVFYNRRLAKVFGKKPTRKKELAVLIVVPLIIILASASPLLTYFSLPSSGETIRFTDARNRLYYSTSELNPPMEEGGLGEFGPQNLFDNNTTTCWAEGVEGPGIGGKIYLSFKGKQKGLTFVNGCAKNDAAFKENNRIKKIRFSLYSPKPAEESPTELFAPMRLTKLASFTYELIDWEKPQNVFFSENWIKKEGWNNVLSAEILSVYKGDNKSDNTCVSEISFFEHLLFLRKNDTELWEKKKWGLRKLLKSPDSVLQIIETAGDWAILAKMPLNPPPGRVETAYSVFNIPEKKETDLSESGFRVGQIYGFDETPEALYLNAFDNKSQRDVRINLSELEDK